MLAEGALSGLLVADFSRVLAGPYMTMLLGDLGATVVKVESPSGDATRSWGPPWHDGDSTYYRALNRSKRAIVLDLAEEEDRGLALELARRADVLIENMMPGKMIGFGLGYEQLAADNPRLVYCSISGFGSQDGGAALPGYDLLGQALSGLMSITGPHDGPHFKVGVALVDVLCGLHGALAVLAALHARARTGSGQQIEVDLLSSALSALTNQAAGFLLAGVVPSSLGNGHPSVAPYEPVPTADGDLVLAVGTDRQFRLLCDVMGNPELADDARFATNAARVEHREELIGELTSRLAHRSRDDVASALRAVGVPCGAVNSVAEAFAFADSIGLQPTWELDDGRYVRAPFRLSATPARAAGAPPALDEHGDELRAWLRA